MFYNFTDFKNQWGKKRSLICYPHTKKRKSDRKGDRTCRGRTFRDSSADVDRKWIVGSRRVPFIVSVCKIFPHIKDGMFHDFPNLTESMRLKVRDWNERWDSAGEMFVFHSSVSQYSLVGAPFCINLSRTSLLLTHTHPPSWNMLGAVESRSMWRKN